MARIHDDAHRRGNYRLVDPTEIRRLHDLDSAVVFLTEHLAIDFAANGIRFYDRITVRFSDQERLFMLYLCFGLLKHPHRWLSVAKLVDVIYPLPEDDTAKFAHKPEHCLHTLATQLRRKLHEDRYKPVFLCCAKNQGYMLRAEPGFGYAFVRTHRPPTPPEFS